MVSKQIDVQFKNPFYHNQFGLLGSSDDHDTVYTLPDDTILPGTAVVIGGKNKVRKKKTPRRAHKEDGRFAEDDKRTEDVNEAYEVGAQPHRPVYKTPVEGAVKVVETVRKKSKTPV